MHRGLEVPDGDILIHAGDMTEHGTLSGVRAFNQWLGEFPHTHKIVIAGNHDFCFEDTPEEAKALLTNACYLQEESVALEGLKFYGSPWTPKFSDWAFMRQPGPEMGAVWENIPPDTDVLITHGPPRGIRDLTEAGEHAGCADLLEAVAQIAPRVHIFGHIHEGRGIERENGAIFVNGCSISVNYRQLFAPFVIEV